MLSRRRIKNNSNRMSTGERSSSLIDMKIDTSGKKVRSFGFLFTFVMIALAAFRYYKGGNSWIWFVGGAGFFLLTGMFLKPVLRPIYVLRSEEHTSELQSLRHLV